MANDKDVEAGFDARTKNGSFRTDAVRMQFGPKTLWTIQMIGGIFYLDEENGVHREDDFILIEWGYAGQMLWNDQLIIADREVHKLWSRLDDPRHGAKDNEAFESRIQLPFHVQFADVPQVPWNIRDADVHIAFMTQQDASIWPTNQFRLSSVHSDGTIVAISPPDYRRKTK